VLIACRAHIDPDMAAGEEVACPGWDSSRSNLGNLMLAVSVPFAYSSDQLVQKLSCQARAGMHVLGRVLVAPFVQECACKVSLL